MATRRKEAATKTFGYIYGGTVLANGEVAVPNKVAFLNTATGEVQASAAATTLIPLGYFTKAQTGDGDTPVEPIDLFRMVEMNGFKNDDAPNAVTLADVGQECYFKDGETVSMLSTSRSKAGRVWGFDSEGRVLVEGGPAVTGPTGATGAATVADIVNQARYIDIPLASLVLADGNVLAPWADGSADGLDVDTKFLAVRWNPQADNSYTKFYFSAFLPQDLDGGQDVVVEILCSKVGETLADAVTFDIEAYEQVVGALHDADANFGGATSAMTGDAASKTVQKVTRTLTAANVSANTLAAPVGMTFSIKPTNDTLQTDDVLVFGIRLKYTPKLAA